MKLKKYVLWIFLPANLVSQQVHAFVPPSIASTKVPNSIAALIALKINERSTGTALTTLTPVAIAAAISSQANDSNYQKTIGGVSVVVTAALSAAIAAGTAPVWATIALGTAAAVVVPLAVGMAANWLINSDGSVTVGGGTPTNTGPGSGVVKMTGPGLQDQTYSDQRFACPGGAYCNNGRQAYSLRFCGAQSENYCELWMTQTANGTTYENFQGQYIYTGQSSAHISPYTAGSTPVPFAQAQVSVSPADLVRPANPQLVADMVNKVWQNLPVQPGVVPYDPANPVKVADVQALDAYAATPANISTGSQAIAQITVADLVLGGGLNPVTGVATISVPGSVGQSATSGIKTTQTTVTTNTAQGSTSSTDSTSIIDWGTFVAPNVESPSIESILDPLFNMFPEWKTFAFPPHVSTCPKPQFSLPGTVLNGHTINFHQMCDFLDYSNTRSFMEAAFAVAWTILIIMIIMGA